MRFCKGFIKSDKRTRPKPFFKFCRVCGIKFNGKTRFERTCPKCKEKTRKGGYKRRFVEDDIYAKENKKYKK